MAWCLIKHRNNFTFAFTGVVIPSSRKRRRSRRRIIFISISKAHSKKGHQLQDIRVSS
jgi:hypothetical protein